MKRLEERPEIYLATTARMLVAEGMFEAAKLLKSAEISVDETGFDNWNGGTRIWTIYLNIEPETYAQLGSEREVIQEQIEKRLKPIVEQFTDDWFSVVLAPKTSIEPEWREQQDQISAVTRRNIIDGLKIDQIQWNGRLDDVEFLARIFDLEAMPSHDGRFETASRDIWQHRINNFDWDDDWIYGDRRFNLISGPSDTFLRFLCEVVHPVVRPDRNETLKLVSQFNDQLRREGWELVEVEKIAGRPRFEPRQIRHSGGRSVSRARTVADALDASWMHKEIERVENAIETDPALAIGTAKDLVESCCKSILERRNITPPKSADLPKLTKMVTTELRLVPDGISDQAKGAETIKLILRNLSALTQYLAELRGLYGSGHGRDGKYRGLQPRHARLAVGTAVAFIDFITATYRKQTDGED
ncbi:abortive infection family protein [Roseibium sp.]|uniref:abortive infection family protein n=1 Tax=Roseibium sp. TaxID=1936156 RepID=UPI003A986A45